MHKILITLLALMITMPANADNIEKIFIKQHINPAAVSISVKDMNTGEKVYSLNDKTPRNPASTLKIVTVAASVDTLGFDYEFKTGLYKSVNNDLYLKLGADPFLTSADLKTLVGSAKDKDIVPKTIFIDASIFDFVEWGEGWQWDDELNPSMPKFSAYNLDNNMINIEITPKQNGAAPTIIIKPFYPFTIMNLIKTKYDEPNNIKFEKNNNISPNIINAYGTVSKQITVNIPVNNPYLYFNLRLQDAITAKKLEYYSSFKNGVLPEKNTYLVDEIKHDINKAISESLKNSSNFISETLYKLAGAKYTNSTGTIYNSDKMLKAYLNKQKLITDDIRIVDGSGVSKNNLITSDFMTDFLIKLSQTDNFEEYKAFLPTPGEGTLKNRMLYFKDNMRAKTGTLSNASAITGYITTKRGKNYVFNIMIQDAKTSDKEKKNIEEYILREIYTK